IVHTSIAIIPEKYTYIVPCFLSVRKLALLSGRQRVSSLCLFPAMCQPYFIAPDPLSGRITSYTRETTSFNDMYLIWR
ncbi:MAG: hypothetical protein RBT80_23015, partial [Candidatus Vecturithrix sp.]|nr:hypothetical protein [Candidatus Vecturithrix sp.]